MDFDRGRTRQLEGGLRLYFWIQSLPDLTRPPLPPGVEAGGHGGSHGRLTDEFITAILQNRKPMIDITMALNMTIAGIVAHQSALRDGELLKIPQYKLDDDNNA